MIVYNPYKAFSFNPSFAGKYNVLYKIIHPEEWNTVGDHWEINITNNLNSSDLYLYTRFYELKTPIYFGMNITNSSVKLYSDREFTQDIELIGFLTSINITSVTITPSDFSSSASGYTATVTLPTAEYLFAGLEFEADSTPFYTDIEYNGNTLIITTESLPAENIKIDIYHY